MTIEECISLKLETEKKIRFALMEFQDKTGLVVKSFITEEYRPIIGSEFMGDVKLVVELPLKSEP